MADLNYYDNNRENLARFYWTASDNDDTKTSTLNPGDHLLIWFSDEVDFDWYFTTSSDSDEDDTEFWADNDAMGDSDIWATLNPSV